MTAVAAEGAVVPGAKVSRVVQDTLAETPLELRPYLGTKQAMRDVVKRAKRLVHVTPTAPTCFEDFKIENPKTISSCDFLLDRLLIGKRIRRSLGARITPFLCTDEHTYAIVFTTASALDHLAASTHWIMDGTFKSSPSIFTQIYTIHGFIGSPEAGRSFPLVFSLLSRKSKSLYKALLEVS